MGSLSFVVKQKKKRIKLGVNKKTLLNIVLSLSVLIICYISCFFIIKLNKNYLSTIILPNPLMKLLWSK